MAFINDSGDERGCSSNSYWSFTPSFPTVMTRIAAMATLGGRMEFMELEHSGRKGCGLLIGRKTPLLLGVSSTVRKREKG